MLVRFSSKSRNFNLVKISRTTVLEGLSINVYASILNIYVKFLFFFGGMLLHMKEIVTHTLGTTASDTEVFKECYGLC